MRRLAFPVLAMLAGCFGEDPSGSNPDCPDGTELCACYGNDTCNDGLRCITEANLCIAEDCTPGKAGCTCVDGECLGAATCDNGVCIAPSTGSGTADEVTSATTDVTSASTSAGESGGSGDSTASETGPADLCGMCFDEAVAMGVGDCEMPATACLEDPACADYFACVNACTHDDPSTSCIDGCCEGAPAIAGALSSCLGFACTDNGDGVNDDCPPLACG